MEEPILELDDIQGNIIPGFKKDCQHFLFFRITDPVLAKAWLKKLVPKLSTANEVLKSHQLWKDMRTKTGSDPDNLDFMFINCALSADGLKKLGVTGVEQFDDSAFKLGLEERAGAIGDPTDGMMEPGSPETWLFGSRDKTADIVIILATDDAGWARQTETKLIEEAVNNGFILIHMDSGKVRPGKLAGHEHFGFRDGLSFPAIRGRVSAVPGDFIEARDWPPGNEFDLYRNRYASPGRQLVWPGHFIFGYPRQFKDDPEVPRENSAPAGPVWAKNGSFMVYRRLQQDVAKFHDFLASGALTLRNNGFAPDITPEKLGAILVGRWPSGWPVMRGDADKGSAQQGENYFGFSEPVTAALPGDLNPLSNADPEGITCPFSAHIRKVQPRDDSTDQGSMERTFQKLLIRRGITYGPEMTEKEDHADRGLLFVSYQSSITDQFEFIMNDWVNDQDKPKSAGGQDPILSGSKDFIINLKNKDTTCPLQIPGKWVTATGGGYFFSPGIAFFSDLL